jgi:hypothetical protein
MTGNITMNGTETVDGRDLSVDGAKLDAIETSATADQTAAEVTSTATTNIVATTVQTALAELDTEKLALAGGEMTGNITMNGTETVDGRDLSVDGAKLDAIETSATADQTAAEVTSTATTNIVATTVQTALTELDAEKLALAGGTMSGNIDMGTNNISNTGSITATTFVGNVTGNILDSNSNGLITGSTTASAVNEITIANAATGSGPTISATGDDTNIDLNLTAKGTGVVNTSGDLTVGGTVTTSGIADSNSGSNINTTGGDQTINSMSGRFRILTGFDTDVIITNSLVTNSSIIICTITSGNSSGTFIQSAIPSSGFFTVTIDAGVGYDLDINFLIIN